MTPKLRTIKTHPRASTVKRSDVAAAAKAVIMARYAATGRFAEEELLQKSIRQQRRKQK